MGRARSTNGGEEECIQDIGGVVMCKLVKHNTNENLELYLMGYNVVKSVESQPTFQRNMFLHLQGRRISLAKLISQKMNSS
jgi:hypothetical protein